MTFADGKMPPSTDMVEFTIFGDKVGLYCLACGTDLAENVNYLNEAIKVWTDHQEAEFKGR